MRTKKVKPGWSFRGREAEDDAMQALADRESIAWRVRAEAAAKAKAGKLRRPEPTAPLARQWTTTLARPDYEIDRDAVR